MAVQLTRAQYNQIYGQAVAEAPESTLDSSPTVIPMTKAEYNAKYRPQELGFLGNIKQDLTETGTAIRQAVSEGTQKTSDINQRVQTGETSVPKSLYQRFGIGLSTTGNAAFQSILGIAKTFTPEKVEQAVSGAYGATIDEISQYSQEFLQQLRTSDDKNDRKIASQIDEFIHLYKSDNDFRSTIDATGGIADGLLTALGFKTGVKPTYKIAETADTAASSAIRGIKETADKLFRVSDDAVVKKRVQDIFNIENSYAKTRNLNDAFSDNGYASRLRIASTDVLTDAVDDNGIIRTTEKGGAIDQYKAVTGLNDVEDIVKRILIKEDKTVTLDEIGDYLKTAIYTSNIEGSDLTRAINSVTKELEGINQRAFQDGTLPLSRVQDFKIAATKNINYLVDSTPTIELRKAKAAAYKQLIEDKSTAPIKDINAKLAEYYKDIERLRELDGRRVKGGRLGKHFASTGGQIIGAAGGSFGGPAGAALGGIAGGELAAYLQGRAMSRAFGRATRGLPEKSPLLQKAKRYADEVIDLTKPDNEISLPEGLPKTPEVAQIERRLRQNIKSQKAAIKKGDFALVATLKDIYRTLVTKLRDYVNDYIENIDENIGAGLSIKKSVTPEKVAKNMDFEDFDKITRFLADPVTEQLDPNILRMFDAMGIRKADLETQVSFLKEVTDEADRMGKLKELQNPPVRNLNQSDATTIPTTAQTIDSTVDNAGKKVNTNSTQSATTKTTDLELKTGFENEPYIRVDKYDSLDTARNKMAEQLRREYPEGIKLYHMTTEGVDEAIKKGGFKGGDDVYFSAVRPIEGRVDEFGNDLPGLVEVTIYPKDYKKIFPDELSFEGDNAQDTIANFLRDGVDGADITIPKSLANKLVKEQISTVNKTTDLLEEARKFVANSKVKTPLYHSGPEGITEFKTGSSGGGATFGEGVYLTPSKETASIYSNQGKNKIYEVYADIRKPLDIEKVDEETWLQFIQQSSPEKKRAWLEKNGYDAVIDLEEGGNNEIMVLRPEQIKIVD